MLKLVHNDLKRSTAHQKCIGVGVAGGIGSEGLRNSKFHSNLLESNVDSTNKFLRVLVLLLGGLTILNDFKDVFIRSGVFDTASVNNLRNVRVDDGGDLHLVGFVGALRFLAHKLDDAFLPVDVAPLQVYDVFDVASVGVV